MLINCTGCRTRHEQDATCPRGWCVYCGDWHTRDDWGDMECPGWHCGNCDAYHDYGDECPGWFCNDCDDYHDYGDECSRNCGCESPQPDFTIRNDGEPPLASGTRARITLPADEISPAGLREIRYYLVNKYRESRTAVAMYHLAHSFEEALGAKWQTRQGNYTKRLSRHAYEAHSLKLTPEIMSQVGCIARDHSATAVSLDIEVTRNLNKPSRDFYNSGSCWWGGMSDSRCALKTNGGFALRSFKGDSVSGRAWVMPLRRAGEGFEPVLDTMTPDAFIVFNGYGALEGYTAARIMAAMAGWTYKKISDFRCDPMYVNSGGYLVAPEQIVQDAGTSLRLTVPKHANLTEKEQNHAA